MKLVNIGVAIKTIKAPELAANLHYDTEGNRLLSTIPDDEVCQLHEYASGFWKNVVHPETGEEYRIVSFYIPLNTIGDDDNRLTLVESLLNRYPDDIAIVGAWNKNGSQYGTTLIEKLYEYPVDLSDMHNPVFLDKVIISDEIIIGEPVYPINPLVGLAMPDIVVYDSENNEISRTSATQPKEVHKLAGWKDRRWDT